MYFSGLASDCMILCGLQLSVHVADCLRVTVLRWVFKDLNCVRACLFWVFFFIFSPDGGATGIFHELILGGAGIYFRRIKIL